MKKLLKGLKFGSKGFLSFTVMFTPELQLPGSDSRYRLRNEMLACLPCLGCALGRHRNCCPGFAGLTPLPFDLNVEGHFICSEFQLLSATY